MSPDLARPQLEQSLNPVQRTIIYRAFALDQKSADLKNLLLTAGTEALRRLLKDPAYVRSKQILKATGLDILLPQTDLIKIELDRLLSKALSTPYYPLDPAASANYATEIELINRLRTKLQYDPINQYTEQAKFLLDQAKAMLNTNAERNYLTGVTFFIGLCRLLPNIDEWLTLIGEQVELCEANEPKLTQPEASQLSAPRAEPHDTEG